MTNLRVMTAARNEGARKMSLPERQVMEKELRDLEAQLDGRGQKAGGKDDPLDSTESRPDLLQDRPALVARKKKLEELLTKDDDLKALSPEARLKLSKEAKELEARLAKHMLSERERGERATVKRLQDYETAVQKTVYQQKNYLPDLQRWQEIMRQLFPDDPTMCDVRRIKSA